MSSRFEDHIKVLNIKQKMSFNVAHIIDPYFRNTLCNKCKAFKLGIATYF